MAVGKEAPFQIRSGSLTVILLEVTASTTVKGYNWLNPIKSPTLITPTKDDAVVIIPVVGAYAVALTAVDLEMAPTQLATRLTRVFADWINCDISGPWRWNDWIIR